MFLCFGRWAAFNAQQMREIGFWTGVEWAPVDVDLAMDPPSSPKIQLLMPTNAILDEVLPEGFL